MLLRKTQLLMVEDVTRLIRMAPPLPSAVLLRKTQLLMVEDITLIIEMAPLPLRKVQL